MYFGEVIVLASVIVCLYGLYDASISYLRNRQSVVVEIVEDENHEH